MANNLFANLRSQTEEVDKSYASAEDEEIQRDSKVDRQQRVDIFQHSLVTLGVTPEAQIMDHWGGSQPSFAQSSANNFTF
mmetsp:Transcript_31148/g.47637  ORF Transcript_31148/g.47637 Transcript_31148/m.47637 type:complete len:80 (+) Transcript_31148:1396-1635(+)